MPSYRKVLPPATYNLVAQAGGRDVSKVEATFDQTLGIVKRLDAARLVMTHIEESLPLDYDDYLTLAGQLQAQGLSITFAYDTLMVDV